MPDDVKVVRGTLNGVSVVVSEEIAAKLSGFEPEKATAKRASSKASN